MHARSLVHQSACMQVVPFHCAVRGQFFCDAVFILLGVLHYIQMANMHVASGYYFPTPVEEVQMHNCT